MDVRTHTYHIALVQIYLFIFYFSSYFTAQKINYIIAMKSINQSINQSNEEQKQQIRQLQ
jgi:hypothetical protein